MESAPLTIESSPHDGRIVIKGPLDLAHFDPARKKLDQLFAGVKGRATIDASGITRLDSAGALLLHQAEARATLGGLSPEHEALFHMIEDARIVEEPAETPPAPCHRMVERLGKSAYEATEATAELVAFLGQTGVAVARALMTPWKLRLASITHHVEQIGINAIPIISLIAFLMSIILAYQGLAQLRPLGAEQYTVNLIAISVLREMSVLLAAIMVAGRSGSAFTAEIGVMKEREEVDALRTIGFDPFELLVVPRILGLLIALPLLTFIADMAGLFGGAIISLVQMNLSLPEYMERVRHAAHLHDMMAGLIKAPVFALAIGLVGCMHGLKVEGSSESVGRETTASVVQSIFLVLMLDGVFSIFFQKIGL